VEVQQEGMHHLVRELGGGKGNVSFDYRIVARRLGYEDVRLAPVVEPQEGPRWASRFCAFPWSSRST